VTARAGPAADNDCDHVSPAIIYPKDPKNQAGIQSIRDKIRELDLESHEVKSDQLGFTAFFWVGETDQDDLAQLRSVDEVRASLQACRVNRSLKLTWM
jgi:hypothetical protein